MQYLIQKLSRDKFILESPANEQFRKYFIRECDEINGWSETYGAFGSGLLLGAITFKIPRKRPLCANIKLLYVFPEHQRKGIGEYLCQFAFEVARQMHCSYFRVSVSPDAYDFYHKVGFKYWGRQRSGCYLSIFKISDTIKNGIYARDSYIEKCLTKGCRGSLKEEFNAPI